MNNFYISVGVQIANANNARNTSYLPAKSVN